MVQLGNRILAGKYFSSSVSMAGARWIPGLEPLLISIRIPFRGRARRTLCTKRIEKATSVIDSVRFVLTDETVKTSPPTQ